MAGVYSWAAARSSISQVGPLPRPTCIFGPHGRVSAPGLRAIDDPRDGPQQRLGRPHRIISRTRCAYWCLVDVWRRAQQVDQRVPAHHPCAIPTHAATPRRPRLTRLRRRYHRGSTHHQNFRRRNDHNREPHVDAVPIHPCPIACQFPGPLYSGRVRSTSDHPPRPRLPCRRRARVQQVAPEQNRPHCPGRRASRHRATSPHR